MAIPKNHLLLLAALRLQALGRGSSVKAILAYLFAQPEGLSDVRGFIVEQALLENWGMLGFALTALARLSLEAAEAAWKDLSDALVGRPMAPELLALQLSHARKSTPSVATGAGPDICYVLALSLPQDITGYSMRSQAMLSALQDLPEPRLRLHCMTRPGFPWHRGLQGSTTADIVDGITYHRCGTPKHQIPKDLAQFRAAEVELLERFTAIRPRLIMAASNHGTAIPALLAARRLRIPFIYDVRGFWEYSGIARDPNWEHDPAYRAAYTLETMTASEADLVFTLTGAMRDELIHRGVQPGRIHLVPNAADPGRFSPRPRDAGLVARLGLAKDMPVIGYAGSFNIYEGLDDLIAAAGELARRGHDFRLLLIGDKPDSKLSTALRAQAEALGIGERLILPGRVPMAEIPAWYSLIDIAPTPRKLTKVTSLVSPLKPLEAMAMARAVVVSDLPPLAELVRHDETGLTCPSNNPTALSHALERLLVDASLRQRLGQNARDWLVAERSWAAVASNMATTINAVFPVSAEPGQ